MEAVRSKSWRYYLAGALAVTLQPGVERLTAQSEVPEWTVSVGADRSIGRAEGPEEYTLVNPLDGTVLKDGTIVLADFSTNYFALRYYDSEGRHLVSAGRFGQGPFEFSMGIASVEALPGDSVLVLEVGHRYSLFGSRGERIRSGRLNLPGAARSIGVLGPEGVVAFRRVPAGNAARPGLREFRTELVFLPSPRGSASTIATLPVERAAMDGIVILHLPFEPTGYAAVGPGRVWYGHSASARLESFAVGSDPALTIELARAPRPVSRSDQTRWRQHDLEGVTGDRRERFEAFHRRVEFPEYQPRFQALEVDALGRVWVLVYEPRWSEADYEWEIFDRQGRWIANATVPFRVLGNTLRTRRSSAITPIMEIGADYLLIRKRTEEGVPVVAKHRIMGAVG